MSNFEVLKVADVIISNALGWHYDNCKVRIDDLKARSLAKVIEEHGATVPAARVHVAWGRAVKQAHAAKVDGMAKDPTAYAVACFKQQLAAQREPTAYAVACFKQQLAAQREER